MFARFQALFSSPTKNEPSIQTQLEAAMHFTLWTCVLGSSNRIEDIMKTNGYSHYLEQRYNFITEYKKDPKLRYTSSNTEYNEFTKKRYYPNRKWYCYHDSNEEQISLLCKNENANPIEDSQFNLTSQIKESLIIAMLTEQKREGNCGARSNLLAKFLWEHAAKNIKKIEIVSALTFDHVFVIVNRQGDLHDSTTWGNAWIADPWYKEKGLIYPAAEFKEKIKLIRNFAKLQSKELSKIHLYSQDQITPGEETIKEVLAEIDLSLHKYPRYDNRKLESYYAILNSYPKDWEQTSGKLFSDHKRKFSSSLSLIKNLNAEEPKFKKKKI